MFQSFGIKKYKFWEIQVWSF